jgi:hypothetical protein
VRRHPAPRKGGLIIGASGGYRSSWAARGKVNGRVQHSALAQIQFLIQINFPFANGARPFLQCNNLIAIYCAVHHIELHLIPTPLA